MKKLLVICDREKAYAERLADYLSHRRECSYDICIFTTIESLMNVFRGKHAEIMLIEQFLYMKLVEEGLKEFISVDKILLLSDSKISSDFIEEESVYKYQSATSILGKLLSECLDYGMGGYGESSHEESELIGIYSPVKRSLKTTFSYTLAQILSEKDSVLYLNFEGCSGISNLISVDTNTNIADLLYDYSIYREEYPKRFAEFIQSVEGIGIIPPVETVSELQCIPTDDWVSMLRRLKRNEVYKKIVLDVGDNVNGIIDILRMCDVIYMPSRDDFISNAKMNAFDTAIQKYDSSDDLSAKIHKLEFPQFNDLGESFENIKYSELGGYVRELVSGNKALYQE